MRIWGALVAAAAVIGAAAPAAAQQAPAWDPEPWVQDLAQIRATIDTKYANREWLTGERELDLDDLFGRAERLLRTARSDAGAVLLLNRVVERIGDGHVALNWPRPPAPPASPAAGKSAEPGTAESLCRSMGYNGTSAGLAPAVAGYTPLPNAEVLPAGTATVGGTKLGFLRIGIFMPQGYPLLCHQAVADLGIPLDEPCDEDCQNRIITHAYRGLGAAMMDRLAALKTAGAEVLVVDITGNGGGSEWAEAAARMLSRRALQSARMGFVRSTHWVRNWQRLIDGLTPHRDRATGAERRQLDAYLAEARAALAEAERTCAPGAADCPRIARAGYATGLVGKAPAGAFAGKDWAVWVFNAAQHTYRDGVWDGPVILLADGNTASAAEQFVALLRDNDAAIVLGSRTTGAGCGHTWGGTPTKLANSGATLTVPDCVRYRADGSNEVRGIIPDQLIGWRTNDGRAFRARLLEAALPDAIAQARALYGAAR